MKRFVMRRHLQSRSVRRRIGAVVVVATGFVTASGAAYAYFSIAGSGSAQDQAETLAAPGTGSVGTATAVNLPINWVNSSNLPSSGGSPDGYQVFRSTASGSQGAVVPSTSGCYGSGGTVSQGSSPTGCTDSGLVPNTTYYYEVESAYDNWTSAPNTQFSGTTSKQATTTALSGVTPTTGTAGTTSFSATATVSGNSGYGTPAGSVVFGLYSASNCSGTAAYTTTSKTLSGGTVTGSITPTASGTYYWGAAYTPSDSYNLSSSGCNSSTPIVVSSGSVFSATSLGSVSTTCTAGTGKITCTGPSISTTSPLVIFANVTGANATITATAVGGPVSSQSTVTSVREPTTSSSGYLYAWKATGSGGPATAVTITFTGPTTVGNVVIDVVQLGSGNSVTSTFSSGAGNTGGGNTTVPVSLTAASSSDGELVFLGSDNNLTFSGPSGFTPQLAGGSGSGYGWGAFGNATIQSTSPINFTESASNKDYGYIALEINP